MRTAIALCVSAAVMPSVHAQSLAAQSAPLLDPLALRNPSVLTRLYGIPAALPAQLLQPQASLWQFSTTVANTFSRDSNGNEAVFLDGELAQLQLGWRYGAVLGEQALELYASLEAVHHSGGFLDHGIEQFHSALGLPQGNRTRYEQGNLRYAYRDGDQLPFEFDRSGAALGDLQLGVALPLYRQDEQVVSSRLTLKLPTGDADRLAGSGAADIALSLNAGTPAWHGRFDAAGGVVWLGNGDVLTYKQRKAAAFGHLAYAYPWSSGLALVAQLGANTGIYSDTSMEGLKNSAFLVVGARWRVEPQWSVEVAVTEDVLINSTPDVAFTLGLRFSPELGQH